MGKKKTQQHASQSFGSMVSKAALTQLQPFIVQLVRSLGNDLAQEQQGTMQLIYTRLVALEKLLIEKNITTQEEHTNRVADVEDQRDNLQPATEVEKGDMVRLVLRTKTNDQPEFQGSNKLKLVNAGTGSTLGTDIESSILGMKTGEVKEIKFGQQKELTAEITISRIARPILPTPSTPPVTPVPEQPQENSSVSST
jgi:hypothetical protein